MHENKMLSAVLIGAAAVLSTSLVGWHYHGKHRRADAVTEADLVALEAAVARAEQTQAELDAKLAEHGEELRRDRAQMDEAQARISRLMGEDPATKAAAAVYSAALDAQLGNNWFGLGEQAQS